MGEGVSNEEGVGTAVGVGECRQVDVSAESVGEGDPGVSDGSSWEVAAGVCVPLHPDAS